MDEDHANIHRDIAPGETLRHEGGELVIHGNIGAGARIEAAGAGLVVRGDVGDGVFIRTRAPKGTIFGAKIEGTVGDGVTIDTSAPVILRNGAGDRLRIRSVAGACIGTVGDNAQISTPGTVTGGDVGMNAHIRCGQSCTIGTLGAGSTVTAGGGIQATTVGHDCQLACGGTANIAALGADSILEAQGIALVNLAHAYARAAGAQDLKIKATSRRDADFRIPARPPSP